MFRLKIAVLIFIFFLILVRNNYIYAEEKKEYNFSREFPRQFSLKFNERIANSTDYILIDFCLKESLTNPEHGINFCFSEQEHFRSKAKTDLADSISYAGTDFFLNADFGKKIRRYFIRISSIEVAKNADNNNIKTTAAAVYEPLEPIEEEIRKKENNLKSLGGNNLKIEKEKKEIEQEIDILRSRLSKKYDFRWKFGFNFQPDILIFRLKEFHIDAEPFAALLLGDIKIQASYYNDYSAKTEEKNRELRMNFEKDFPNQNFYPSLRYTYDLVEQKNKADLKFRKRFSDQALDIVFSNQYEIEEKKHLFTLSLNKLFQKSILSFNTQTDWRDYSLTVNFLFQF